MELSDKIVEKIRDLEKAYQKSQGLILTEEDLQCHLFRLIHPLFHDDLDTMDQGIRGGQLHSEVKFFDDQEKLSIIPDITILDTARLSILHSVDAEVSSKGIKYQRYPTKMFEFGGSVMVIELKFCRSKFGISKKDLVAYQRDFDKINRLRDILRDRSGGVNNLFGLFVVFNKTDLKTSAFEDFLKLESNYVKIVYCSGKVEFPQGHQYLSEF